MKCKLVFVGIALLSVSSSWAATDPYYSIEEISVDAGDNATYGPYPSAMSDDGTLIGTYSMRSLLSRDIDIGLPFTFNRGCQYDDVFCEVEFYGSESTSDLNYENGYQAWRNAQADAEDDGYSSYMMGNLLVTTEDDSSGTNITTIDNDYAVYPYDGSYTDSDDYSSDVKVTDVFIDGTNQFVVGYSSDVYDSSNERSFVRRAFIEIPSTTEVTSLLPEFYTDTDTDDADDANGGFSSAYKIKEVTINSITYTLVVGSGSISLPEDDDSDDVQDYFDACYFSDETDEISTLNDLVYCSGFDTQAWAWDVSNVVDGTETEDSISGFELASEWLDDNDDNDSSDITYSASALDINSSGIAVGVSTFEYSDSATGGRQRAIIMTPYTDDNGDDSYVSTDTVTYATDDDGNDYVSYGAPIELSKASYTGDEGDSGDDDSTYNTWAVAITDTNTVIGNREYSVSKNVNKPTEFFVYDLADGTIDFPLQDEMVLTTEQRLNGESSASTGANSRAYDINEDGFIVGKSDDYDQTHPVYGGMPRTQSAFLYDNGENSDDNGGSWFINDLICTEDADGVVTSPLYKIRSARIINDDGTVLAEGWKYDSDSDYQDETGATEVMLKLTRNTSVTSPDDSPNCWESDLLTSDDSYDRSGAASFWLWIFALPLLLVRRFFK